MARARPVLLVLSACLLLAAAIGWALGRRTGPDVAAPTAPVSAPRVGEEAASQVAAALAAAAPLPDASGIPHTRLPLRLLATVVREDAALSLATIVDVERPAQAVMSEGESFEGHPSARIARIERGRVLIDNAGVREQLVIEGRAAFGSERTPEERERRRERGRRLRALTDAGTNYREVLGSGERGGLLADGDVSAVYEDGELVGVQLDGIRPGGLYEKIGLRDGDVVTGINGISLGDPDAAAQVIGQLVTSDELIVDVERGTGPPEQLVVPAPELRESLVGLQTTK
jgi:general secretion pathway protein C